MLVFVIVGRAQENRRGRGFRKDKRKRINDENGKAVGVK
jgi:hypothetical protein